MNTKTQHTKPSVTSSVSLRAQSRSEKSQPLVPQLRFAEFEGEWEQKRTKEIAPLQRGFDLPTSEVIRGEFPVVYSNGILRSHCDFKVKGPGIVTGRSGTIGKVTYVQEDFWPHNTSLWVTDFFKNEPKFIYYFYKCFNLLRYNAGSTVPTLNRNDVHSVKKCIPTLPEQQKIASFLTSVDTKLQQLTQKKELLEQYKKGVMQQLFSQKIRFKPDNSDPVAERSRSYPDWEEKKLGEVATFLDSKRKPIKSSDRVKMKGEYPYYGASGIIDYVNGYLFDEDLILLGEDGENIISRNLPLAFKISGKCWVNNHAHVIKPNKNIDIDFLTNALERIDYLKYNTGTAQPKLNQEVCKGIFLEVPSKQEQQKIANYLSGLDTKIAQVAEALKATQQFKKGLLQQMFV